MVPCSNLHPSVSGLFILEGKVMKEKIDLYLVYILMILYAIYDILNSTSAGNTSDERGIVYIFLIAVVFTMTFFICLNKRILRNSVVATLVIFTIYYFFLDMLIIKQNISWGAWVYFGLTIWWIITICYFRNVVFYDIQKIVSIQKFVRVMFILYSFAVIYGSFNIAVNFSVDYARVGYIYHILAMLPIVLLERKEKVKKIFVIIAIILTVFSFKRGAIIILPIMLIAYYMIESKVQIRKHNMLKIVAMIIIIGAVWVLIDRYSGGYLSSRFTITELADGSGRSEIWKVALDNISKRNIIQMIFGIAVPEERTLWTGIHNEWISYLNTNGILGVILFALFVLGLIMQEIRLIKRKSCLAPAYMAMIVYIFGVCWVSGFLHVHSTFYVMLFIGCIQALLSYPEEEIRKYIGEDL